MPHPFGNLASMDTSHHTPSDDASHDAVLMISCDSCIMRHTDACGDCMMSVLCDAPSEGAVILNLQELREIRLLAQAGLVPTLRHRAVG